MRELASKLERLTVLKRYGKKARMKLLTDDDLTPRDRHLFAQGAGCYFFPVRTPTGGLSCAYRLMYHWALIHDLNDCGYEDRWCYRTQADVLVALLTWSGEDGTEPEGWHKHPATNRCREDATAESEKDGW